MALTIFPISHTLLELYHFPIKVKPDNSLLESGVLCIFIIIRSSTAWLARLGLPKQLSPYSLEHLCWMLEPQCKQAVQLPHGHHAMRKPKLDPVKRIQKEALSLPEEIELPASPSWSSSAGLLQPRERDMQEALRQSLAKLLIKQKSWEMTNHLLLFQATKSWEDLYLS